MSSDIKQPTEFSVPIQFPPPPPHEGSGRAFWRLLTQFDAAKVNPYQGLRNAAGVALPIVVGFMLGMPRGGIAVASGALNVAYSDGSDPYATRAKRMLASSFLCALAVSLGATSGQNHTIAIIVATIWAFGAGMAVAISTTTADLGVISLVLLLIYAAQPLTPHEAAISGVLALAGGLIQTSLSLALWPVQRYEPERRALGAFYLELSAMAHLHAQATTAPAATQHGTAAQQALSGLSRDATLEGVRYRALLTQAERMRLALLMLSRLHTRIERESKSHSTLPILDRYLESAAELLRAIGDSLLTGKPARPAADSLLILDTATQELRGWIANEPHSFLSAAARDARFQMDALGGQIRAALDLATNSTNIGQQLFEKHEAEQPWWLRFSGKLATLRANLNLQSSAYRHALRLTVLVAIGEILGRSISWRRAYWLPMTIVLVLKPEFTTTFTRGLLRISGTIAGLLVATALFHFLPASATVQIVLIFLFVFLLRWIGPANYGIFGIAISALVVLLLAIAGVAPKDVIWARGINTVAGGALALIGYSLWPTWERTHTSERLAQMLDAYREYFHALADAYRRNENTASRELDRTRVGSRVARSNLEAALDRLSAEPGTTAEQMNQLNGILASSHRFVRSLMALDAGWVQTPSVPPRPAFQPFAEDVEETLKLLTAKLRGSHEPANKFPELREDHTRLVQSGDAHTQRYALVNVETDRITNSLNTLREQIEAMLQQEKRAGSDD